MQEEIMHEMTHMLQGLGVDERVTLAFESQNGAQSLWTEKKQETS
jgi:hypothetical protein